MATGTPSYPLSVYTLDIAVADSEAIPCKDARQVPSELAGKFVVHGINQVLLGEPPFVKQDDRVNDQKHILERFMQRRLICVGLRISI